MANHSNVISNQHTYSAQKVLFMGLERIVWEVLDAGRLAFPWCSRARDVSVVKVCKTTEPLQNPDKDIKMSSLATEETVALFLLSKITIINLLNLGQIDMKCTAFQFREWNKTNTTELSKLGAGRAFCGFPKMQQRLSRTHGGSASEKCISVSYNWLNEAYKNQAFL